MVAVASTDGYARFYARSHRSVVAALRPLVDDAAEDVAQEAFAISFERWGEVSTLDAPHAWVRRVGLRIAWRRLWRERMRVERELLAMPGPTVDDVSDVASLLEELTGRQAAIVAMHDLAGIPVAEVADALGMAEGTVRVTLHRARGRLAERVGGYHGRWWSERAWRVDEIRDHLRERGTERHLETVLQELNERGGRWLLTLADGRYRLETDEGLRLDDGRFRIVDGHLQLHPRPSPGVVTFRPGVDGDRMVLRLEDDTTPPTREVPDHVWMDLFMASSAFVWGGPLAV